MGTVTAQLSEPLQLEGLVSWALPVVTELCLLCSRKLPRHQRYTAWEGEARLTVFRLCRNPG